MFRKPGLEVHRGIFEETCNKYKKPLEFHKSSYKTRREQAERNLLFYIIEKLFQPGSIDLPACIFGNTLVKDFNDFDPY